MKDEKAIIFENVSKRFRRGRKLLLKEALLDIFKPQSSEWFYALRDINFEINKGEAVGIIGPNGSGKSTILKLIAGVMSSDNGKITVKGRVSPLIELAAGFHPELSGRENIYLNGVILGLSIKQIDERISDIINFSELEDFIDTPVKHYSSGMYMRLGFSIAVHTSPEILLVDEILAVGDSNFQRKCFKKMQSFKEKGKTIVFVSHDLKAVGKFCERVIYINKGRLIGIGESENIIKKYRADYKISAINEINKKYFI
ncbi:MAG: ABC transporter ATP-binding protein [Ignavibacteria bacterium]|nr:ABC transporter ATP-binding protein [Ignavibacteria bacterium]